VLHVTPHFTVVCSRLEKLRYRKGYGLLKSGAGDGAHGGCQHTHATVSPLVGRISKSQEFNHL